MLPDYPKVKAKILAALEKRLQAQTTPAPFTDAKSLHCHEGHRHRLVRADGSSNENEFHEISGTISIDLATLADLSMEEVVAKVDGVAEEMGRKMASHFFDEISRAVEEVGNVVDGGGRPFTAELYLDSLDKIEMEFDHDGRPHIHSLLGPPHLQARLQAELQRLQDEPVLKRRHDDIMERKREQWRERESSRKLVG